MIHNEENIYKSNKKEPCMYYVNIWAKKSIEKPKSYYVTIWAKKSREKPKWISETNPFNIREIMWCLQNQVENSDPTDFDILLGQLWIIWVWHIAIGSVNRYKLSESESTWWYYVPKPGFCSTYLKILCS